MTTRTHLLSTALTTLTSLAALTSTACADVDAGDDGISYSGGSEDEGIVMDDDGEPLPDLPEDDSGESSEIEDSGTEGDAGPPTCEATTAIASTEPPNVMLVLDKSRSMILNSWDDDDDPATPEVTRWHSLHNTVEGLAFSYDAGMRLGLTLFPSTAASSTYEGACLVASTPELATDIDNAAALLAAIPSANATNLYGATPAAAGLSTALAHLESLDDGRPAAMILVTDGAANCDTSLPGNGRFDDYDENLPAVVADAWERAGIPTYVVGIDIQELSEYPFTAPRDKLDEVASLGGVPQPGEVGFFDAADADGLTAALDTIAASVSCGVSLGEAPSGPDQLVIRVDGQFVDQLDSCDDGDGWVFANDALTRVELCHAACDTLLETGEVEAEFLCPPQP